MSNETAVNEKGRLKKVMKGLDMTLFTVSAVLVIDQLAASAAIGVSSIFWWIFTMILFFIPYGLITAELGSTYPDQGGIYSWVKRAYGDRWGARTSWLYWVNVALWMPSVYVLFGGIFAQLFFPDLSMGWIIAMGIGLTWLTVLIDILSLDIGKWIPNIGAFLKVAIMAIIGVGGFWYASKHGVANDFSFDSMAPSFGAGLAFLPVIVYNFMGFELMSGAGDEMKNPSRDVPKAIITAGLLIAGFYLLGTVGILIALPVDQIGLVDGIIDTFHVMFGDSGVGGGFVIVLGIAALYTFFANMVTWTIGANRSAAEAAQAGDLPPMLGTIHKKYKTPLGASILTGVVSTVVILLYGFMAGTAEDLFWTLFAFSSIVFLVPYLIMFPAFLKLRKQDPDIKRPYRVPGGEKFARVLAIISILFIVQAIVFFLWQPGVAVDWAFVIPVVAGVIITVLLGEWLINRSQRSTEV